MRIMSSSERRRLSRMTSWPLPAPAAAIRTIVLMELPGL
jgi:hypothetical protein